MSRKEIATFVKDISSGFKNGARSMYISMSSEVRCMSSMDIPLLEAGFTNSLEVCLKYRRNPSKSSTVTNSQTK